MPFDPPIQDLLNALGQPPANNSLGLVLSEFMTGTMAWALDSETDCGRESAIAAIKQVIKEKFADKDVKAEHFFNILDSAAERLETNSDGR